MDRLATRVGPRLIELSVSRPQQYERLSSSHASRDDHHVSEHVTREWIPRSLRMLWTCAFATLLALGIIGIEILNAQLDKQHGISSGDNAAVLALRYIPTAIAILIAFAWRQMVTDVALITPWASMSNNWTPAENCVLLNYLDGLDISIIRDSFRKKHWALWLSASCGIFAGALVPIANALPQLRVQESFSYPARFDKESTFTFGTSLLPPIDWRAQLTAQTMQLARIDYSTWSSTDMTYESLDLSSVTSPAVRSVDMTVNAFSASLDCVGIDFNSTFHDYGHDSEVILEATNPRSACSIDVGQIVSLNFNSSNVTSRGIAGANGQITVPLAWTNVTACNRTDDLDFVFTFMQLGFQTSVNQSNSNSVQIGVSAFSCSPKYQMTAVHLRVDPRDLVPLSVKTSTENSTNVDLDLPTDVLYTLIQQPLLSYTTFQHLATNDYSTYGTIPNSLNWSDVGQLNIPQRFANYSLYSDPAAGEHLRADYYMKTFVPFPDDAAATRLADNNSLVMSLIQDPRPLQSALTNNFAITMSQQVNLFGRTQDSASVDVIVNVVQDRYHLRRLSVRLMECFLAVMCISSILVATLLRPRSVLVQSPSSLEMIANLLTADKELERVFEFDNAISDDHARRKLSSYEFVLLQLTSGRVIMRARRHHQDHIHTSSTALGFTTSKKPSVEVLTSPPYKEASDLWHLPVGRYRPFALRGLSRYGLPIVLLATILVNFALLFLSMKRHGWLYRSEAIELCSAYGPTIFLVLAGYAIQSVYVSSRKLEYFHLLNRGKMTVANVMSTGFRSSSKTITMLICTILVLVLPLIKLVVSGLFAPTFAVRHVSNGIASIDLAPFDQYFAIASNLSASNMQAYNLNHGQKNLIFKYTEPDLLGHAIDMTNSYNVPLIKNNFTEQIISASGHVDMNSSSITIRVPGFNTSVDCTQSGVDIFDLRAYIFGDDTFNLTLSCASERCQQYNETLAAVSFSYTSPISSIPRVPQYLSVIESHIQNGSFVIITADFSALSTTAQPTWDVTSTSNGSVVTAVQMGELYPVISAARCEIVMQRVDLNISKIMQDPDALYTQFGSDLDYGAWILDDGFSSNVEVKATYQAPDLPALIFPWPHSAVFAKSSTPDFQRSTTTVSSLVAQFQLNLTGNYLDIFMDNNLASSTTRVLRDIAMRSTGSLIGDLRAGTSLSATNMTYPPPDNKQTQAVLNISRLVIEQNFVRAITLSAFLLVAMACLLYLALLMPKKTMLPRAPSSIANQISLLAGSRLISHLRRDSSTSIPETRLRDMPIKLGWWRHPLPNREADKPSSNSLAFSSYDDVRDELHRPNTEDGGDREDGLRWGLDVGVDVESSLLTRRPIRTMSTQENDSMDQIDLTQRSRMKSTSSQQAWELAPLPSIFRSKSQLGWSKLDTTQSVS